MPAHLAATKCPNSCTKMSTPSTTIRATRCQHGDLMSGVQCRGRGPGPSGRPRGRPRRSPAGPGTCSASTVSMTRLIRPNGMAPARKAATATSLAALKTAGADPAGAARPRRPASNARKTSRRTGSKVSGPAATGSNRRDAGIGQALRVGQRVQDRQLHRGEADLRHDAAVAELHERVHDALRMDHHLDLRRTTGRTGSAPRSPRAPCWRAWRCPP